MTDVATGSPAEENDRFERLMALARPHYESAGDPSHDFAHILRVLTSCETIGAREGADQAILRPAALLHDIVIVPKNDRGRSEASTLAAEAAKPLLRDCGYGDEAIDRIAAVIVEHSFSKGKAASSIEAAVLQDADRLDSLGAIGLFRTATTGCLMGAAYYNVEDPHAEHRALNDKAYTLDHFETKLLKLPGLMNTATAREEAERRAAFMRIFRDEFWREVDGGA